MRNTASDIELRFHKLSGFPSLASFIASDRDRTTFVYKRFDELAARNLLYLQSELAELQSKQRGFDDDDLVADLATKQCARNYAEFMRAAKDAGNERQKERKALMLEIRQTMKDYREALMFESTMATMPAPSKSVLRAFQEEYYNRHDGDNEPFPTLGGSSAGVYDEIDDLVALRVLESPDRLTHFAHEHLAFLFPDRKRSRYGIAYASDRAIESFVA
ncbi:uncharacterized protein N0V89_003455 [Didymosphaeria variabile]|uniref:DUF6594 domain-containing protein n=1 Tax=Didymosphaeria variabile TaxID=1932322 RepID=A0A9W8XNF4_9PLEO|nr:uncharacterized protein N0V89_003455 [Didymosphaeria variabile]KAJ4355439.1 hypothetical protein N0V89_003455 [Didymosphaeria variabile]